MRPRRLIILVCVSRYGYGFFFFLRILRNSSNRNILRRRSRSSEHRESRASFRLNCDRRASIVILTMTRN